MANTQKYLNHLLQNTGITPACSEEERAAADIIAKTFSDHGFEPEVQEFSASGSAKIVQAVLGIAAFVGAVLMGIGGVVGVIGLLLAVAAAVLFTMERTGKLLLSKLGAGGLSQNVIAYHKASGPLASPRNRPVVVVAHYDSPRADFLCQEPYASYRPLLVKLLPYAMLAPAVIAVVRLLPIPDAAKVVLWLLAIVAAVVPMANAAAIIANRFVLPYTTGAVCNKASVAAMLGVMDAVSPYQGAGEEFSEDVPFDEYFAEQKKIAEEAIAAAEAAAAAEPAYPHELEAEDAEAEDAVEGADEDDAAEEETEAVSEDDAEESVPADAGATATFEVLEPSSTVSMDSTDMIPDVELDAGETAVASEEAEGDDDESGIEEPDDEPAAGEDEPEEPSVLNAHGNYRYGVDAIRGLGMIAPSCALVYEAEEAPEDSELTAFDVPAEEDEDLPDDNAETVVDDEADEEIDSAGIEEPAEAEDAAVDDDASDNFDNDDEPIEVAPEDIEVLDEEPEAEEAEPAVEDDRESITDESEDVSEPEQNEAPLEVEAEADQAPAETIEPGSTQIFQAPAAAADDLSRTISMPARPVETVDSLMAEISSAVPAPARARTISVPSTADASSPRVPETANRSSLFDLPDPSASPVDPFAAPVDRSADDAAAAARSTFTVIDSNTPAQDLSNGADRIETISAPAPAREEKRGVFSRLFGRKKKRDDSMSEWLGVEDDYDAKRDGADIGSWDNFDDDDSGWKGGATGAEGVTEDELREAVTSMGDDELLGHDIWFVATGASENGNAGIQAFLNEHRDKLRGVFLINLECIGAGEVSMLATEGEQRTLKGDKRIMKLVSRVSSDFHHEYGAVDMPYVTTDAYPAMSMSLRSLTLGGIEGSGFALGHTEEDQPFNVEPDNVTMVSDVVTEVIRRS